MHKNSWYSLIKRKSFVLRRLSIKNRLLAAFVITSLLPVVFVSVYSNMKYETSVTNKMSAYSMQILDELSQNATRELEQYETLSENIIINHLIQNGIPRFNQMSDYEKNQLQTQIGDEMGQQIFQLGNISNVMILTNSGESFFDLGFELYPAKPIQSMLEETKQSFGNAYWTYLRSSRGTNTIALSRRIYAEDKLNKQLGYLIIFIDEKVFSRNIYKFVNLGAGSSIYISDASGMVISSLSDDIPKGSHFAEKEVFDTIDKQFNQEEKLSAFHTDVGKHQFLVGSSYIRSANWFFVGMIPQKFIVSELSEMRRNIVFICLVVLLLSGMISMWIYFTISNPMRSLLLYAKQIRMGRLEATTSTRNAYPDEMDKLTETIDGMVEQLKQLIGQVQSEQQAKRDAELKMLQAQINPHFLFNTLNSLKWSAMLGGNESVTSGIESLSELLRSTIMVKDEFIPLQTEIENLLHYATIQKIRYGDSFVLHTDVDEDLSVDLVPKFILQPIVENSILHGVGDDEKRVGIWVKASRENHVLTIRITDNGKGFDMNDVKTNPKSHSKLSGLGIANVDERIKLHFGAAFGLVTTSVIGEGTETVITLPVYTHEGDMERYV
ncbi:sensor with HAMP domain protein [Paenibacillus sp. HJL G12]|uniref:histidine kinase n=1 Tax=Paenibacillus dendrobii TaxID=2691084 RepID=A0A7X3LHX4_9BACL|nr:sensor histidine kinase [Paenibacillus dendrobii]MWV43714.1 sensor with HAMP domain protein [Paenibacillus dendrobii]